MTEAWGWWKEVYLLELRKALAYRFDFWARFLGPILGNLGTAYFLWSAIYAHQASQSLGGYSFKGLMLYYLLFPLTFNVVGPAEPGQLAREIYDGSLNKVLVYPISAFGYRFSLYLAHSTVALCQMLLATIAFFLIFGIPYDCTPSVASTIMGISFLMGGTVLYYLIIQVIEMSAFWVENVWNLLAISRMVTALLGGGYVPLEFFPEWVRNLTQHLPFTFVISHPIRALLGRMPLNEGIASIPILIGWILVFYAISLLTWRRGTKQYTGVGI